MAEKKQVDETPKKRPSGRHKTKAEKEAIAAQKEVEVVAEPEAEGQVIVEQEVKPSLSDLISKLDIDTEPEADELKEEVKAMEPVQELSIGANNWKKFLAYQRMTPDEWLEKYSSNKFAHLVRELRDYEAKNKQ